MSQPLASYRQPNKWPNKWHVFGAVSLVFFFLNLATFTSLGVVLYTMVGELHWSLTAAGFSFTFLGLACGLSSPLPAMTMKWFGGRITICFGAALLALGFYLASVSHSILAFYVAMTFLGLGYSFAGNVPGVYVLAAWFERSSARMIGLYYMLGALGAAFGPPIVRAIVSGTGSWRGHWQVMTFAALAIGVVCFALVRDAKPDTELNAEDLVDPAVDPAVGIAARAGAWTPKQAVFTAQFLLVAGAMTATIFCVTTFSSITVSHLVKLGDTPGAAALVLSAIAITATVIKALAGRLCESWAPKFILTGGLILQAAGCVMLAFADTPVLQYLSALTYGTGWGLSFVSGTVIVLDYFGRDTGSKILSIVWMITSLAAIGPPAAGMIADRYGTFSPIFIIYAVMLLMLALPIFMMRAPLGRAQPLAAAAPQGRFVTNAEVI